MRLHGIYVGFHADTRYQLHWLCIRTVHDWPTCQMASGAVTASRGTGSRTAEQYDASA